MIQRGREHCSHLLVLEAKTVEIAGADETRMEGCCVHSETKVVDSDDERESCHRSRMKASVLREKGHEAMRKGQAEMAVHLYSQSLRHESSIPLLCHRAEAYVKLGKYEDAIQDCGRIIKLQPNSWKVYVLRSEALRRKLLFAEAMADLRLARMLCPRRWNHFERLLIKCSRDAQEILKAGDLKAIVEDSRKVLPRPFVKGDKRMNEPAQLFVRMQECLQVISRVLLEPGSGQTVWKEDELDRWKRIKMKNKPNQKCFNYDTLVIVQRLEELRYIMKQGGKSIHQMLGQILGFPTLLAAHDHQELLVLEIIHQSLCEADDPNTMRAFLRSCPLPTLSRSFQDGRPSVRNIACALLDLIASHKSQQILTLLMHDNLMPVLLKSMNRGTVAEHASSVSLFFKLSLDPRLRRHLLTLPLLDDLCEGLIRACRAGKLITRLRGAQAITYLLELEGARQRPKASAVVSLENSCNCTEMSIVSTFADNGVLRAVTQLLARESVHAPENASSSSIWEGDVELICEEIASTVTDFSEEYECRLRDFEFLSGYANVLVHSALRAVNVMACATGAVAVLDQEHAWGLFVPLLSSFPNRLAVLSVKTLAIFCRRSKRVAMHIANLWPANSSLIVLELAESAQSDGDSETYEAAISILAELAACKSFLSSMRKPASFSTLCDFLQHGSSSTLALMAICSCLTVAVTSCKQCLESAELNAYALGTRLLELWCEYRTEGKFRWQVENLMFVLMNHSRVLQQAILYLLESGWPASSTGIASKNQVVSHTSVRYPSSRYDRTAQRYLAFTQKRINFQKVCFFLSSLVQPSAKFADLCAGAGLLSIQVAKHFKEIQCYAVNHKRAWMQHTRRLAKQEAVQNLTVVLSKGFDLLPQTLPTRLDVAILCLCLDIIEDFELLFHAVKGKLQPQGKLVLIDDNEELMNKARSQAYSQGLRVVLRPRILDKYFGLVLQSTRV